MRSQAVAEHLKQQTHALNKVLAKGQDGLQQVLHGRVQQKEKDLFELPPLPAQDPNQCNYDIDSDSDKEDFKEDLLRQLNAVSSNEEVTIHHMDVSRQVFISYSASILDFF